MACAGDSPPTLGHGRGHVRPRRQGGGVVAPGDTALVLDAGVNDAARAGLDDPAASPAAGKSSPDTAGQVAGDPCRWLAARRRGGCAAAVGPLGQLPPDLLLGLAAHRVGRGATAGGARTVSDLAE